jgi:hypothetical protein
MLPILLHDVGLVCGRALHFPLFIHLKHLLELQVFCDTRTEWFDYILFHTHSFVPYTILTKWISHKKNKI